MLTLLLLYATNAILATKCPGNGLTDDERTLLVTSHNAIRRQIAQGSAKNFAGNLNSAQNMYRMKYSCDLEQAAIDAVGAGCSAALVHPPKYGQNVQVYDTQAISALMKNELLSDAVKQWYQPVLYYGLRSASNKYEDPRLYTFANLAYDRNVALGCQYLKCQNKVVISCMYSNIVPVGATLFEKGTPCAKKDDCTIYAPSTCKSDLCDAVAVVQPAVPAGSTTTTAAPGRCANIEVTDAIRDKVLVMHNERRKHRCEAHNKHDFDVKFMALAQETEILARKTLERSQVARGLVKNGRSPAFCPTAANMYKMEYNCALETSALTYAKTCSLTPSPESSRQGQGENVYSGTLMNDLEQAAQTAIEQWWNQINISGVNPAMLFRARVRDKQNGPVAFTQMAWAKSVRLGCAVVKCGTNTFTVCRYSEAGNIVDQYVYNSGKVCGDCPSSCIASEGLCAP